MKASVPDDYPFLKLDSDGCTALHSFAADCRPECLVAAYWLYHSIHHTQGKLPDRYINAKNKKGETPFICFLKKNGDQKTTQALYCALLLRAMGARTDVSGRQTPILTALRGTEIDIPTDVTTVNSKVEALKKSLSGAKQSWGERFQNGLQNVENQMTDLASKYTSYEAPQFRQRGGAHDAMEAQRAEMMEAERQRNQQLLNGVLNVESRTSHVEPSLNFHGDNWTANLRQTGGAYDDEEEEDEWYSDEEEELLMGGAYDEEEDEEEDDEDDPYTNSDINLDPDMARANPEATRLLREYREKLMDEMGVDEETARAMLSLVKRHVIELNPEMAGMSADLKRAKEMGKYMEKSKLNKIATKKAIQETKDYVREQKAKRQNSKGAQQSRARRAWEEHHDVVYDDEEGDDFLEEDDEEGLSGGDDDDEYDDDEYDDGEDLPYTPHHKW